MLYKCITFILPAQQRTAKVHFNDFMQTSGAMLNKI